MTRVKMCGMRRLEDIAAANSLMPEYIGFVFAPASRRYVSPEEAAALKQAPGATDLTNIKIDYKMSCICGINTVDVTMYADAIKY